MEMRVCCKKSICVGRLLGGREDRTPCTASCLQEGAENWARFTGLRKRKQSGLNWGRKAGKVLVRGRWTSSNERGLLGQVLGASPPGSACWPSQSPSGSPPVSLQGGGSTPRRLSGAQGPSSRRRRRWPQPEGQGRGAAPAWARARGGGQPGCAVTKRLLRPRGWAGAQLPPPPSIVRRR